MSEKRWITEKIASAITGISLQTLRNNRWKRKGIPYTKAGKKSVRYDYDDVVKYMLDRKVDTDKE